MAHFKPLTLMAILVAAPMAMGQDAAEGNRQMQALFDKMVAVIQGGTANKNSVVNKNSIVNLSIPGIVLKKALDPRNPADEEYVNRLADMAMSPSAEMGQKPVSVASVYRTILDMKVSPTKGLSPAEEARLQKALADTQGPTIEKYYHLSEQADEANTAVELARLNLESTPRNTKEYSAALAEFRLAESKAKKPRSDWENSEIKYKVKNAFNAILELSAKDGGFWWTDLRNKFNEWKGPNSTMAVQTFPQMGQWLSDGWLKFSYTASGTVGSASKSTQDGPGALRIHKGIFDLKGAGKWEKKASEEMWKDSSLRIEFEMKKVYFNRPWLDYQVFHNENWWWNPGAKGTVISNGQEIGMRPGPAGLLPVIPNGIVIIRNLKFSAETLASYHKEISEMIRANGSMTIGCFHVGGGYEKSDASHTRDGQKTTTSLGQAAPQIIAYFGSIVPRSPKNPNRE